jgi:hypothetical protein
LDLELSSEEDNQSPIGELDSLFEDEVKIDKNQ